MVQYTLMVLRALYGDSNLSHLPELISALG